MEIKPGQRVVVKTPDRHQWRGRLVEVKEADGRRLAVVRLDTGWVTTYPVAIVQRET